MCLGGWVGAGLAAWVHGDGGAAGGHLALKPGLQAPQEPGAGLAFSAASCKNISLK